MADGKYPLLAREGWTHTAVVLAAAVAVHATAGALWAAPLWLATLFVLQFFRDPPRAIPQAADARGPPIVLGDAEDPYLQPAGEAHQHFHECLQRARQPPARGRQGDGALVPPGSFLNAALDKAARENERNALWLRTDTGADVVVVRGCRSAGAAYTLLRGTGRHTGGRRSATVSSASGARVDVYLPVTSRFEVALGDKVRGGTGRDWPARALKRFRAQRRPQPARP